MNRLIIPLVLVVAALVPAGAFADGRAKVLRGTFQAVGADGDYVTGSFGKAQLVDGRRNDKLSVHVRRLAPRAKYVFRLQKGSRACEQAAPAATDVPGWNYRRGGVLKTNRNGVANSSARSRSFAARKGVEYLVAVFTVKPSGAPDQLVLCAELRAKATKGSGKHGGEQGHKAPGRKAPGAGHGKPPKT